MGDKWPLANGNYSAAANWNNGTLPVDGDIIYCDGRTITLDVDINLPNAELRTTQRSGGTAGGGISWSSGTRSITLKEVLAGSSIPLSTSGSAGASFTGVSFKGSATANNRAFSHAGSGNITFSNCKAYNGLGLSNAGSEALRVSTGVNVSGTLDVYAMADIANTNVVFMTSGAVLNLTCRVQHGYAGSTLTLSNVTGTITVIEETFVGTTSVQYYKWYVFSTNLTIDRTACPKWEFPIGVVDSGYMLIDSNVYQRVTLKGDIVASRNFYTFQQASNYGVLIIDGAIYGPQLYTAFATVFANNGTQKAFIKKLAKHPTSGLMPTIINNWGMMAGAQVEALTEAASVTLVPSTSVGDPPAVEDVRAGVAYHFDTLEGTCEVPGPEQTMFGVPVDDTTGTAVLTMANVAAGVTVYPLEASSQRRVRGTLIELYIGETIDVGPIAILDADGNAVSLAGRTLRIVIETFEGTDLAIVAHADIAVTGTGSNQITFTAPAEATATASRRRRWKLEDTADGNRYLGGGIWAVIRGAGAD